MGVVIGIAFIVGVLALAMKIQKNHDEENPWKGVFYKIVDELPEINDSSDFKTLEDCRKWANEKADKAGYKEGEWDYSCGTGCTFKDDTVSGGKKIKNYDCSELTK